MFSIILGIALIGIVLIFAFQNNETIIVSFFSGEFTGSLALVILASFFIGVIIGLIILMPSVLRSSFKVRNLGRENKKLSNKLEGSEAIKYETEGLGEDSRII